MSLIKNKLYIKTTYIFTGDRIQKRLTTTDQIKKKKKKNLNVATRYNTGLLTNYSVSQPCSWTYPANISTSDQRCVNVETTSKTTLHNVEITLHNAGWTLIQRRFNLGSTLVKAILNPIGPVMIMDLQIHE